MNYNETLDWMFSKLPMYQRQGKVAFKKDLTNIIALADHLNNPHKKFKSVHVAGTNGKGSTSHMVASILQEAGYKVGLYTSPHLEDFRERIKINGVLISKTTVINFIKTNKKFLEEQRLSFFEMTVGIAFDHFANQHVDIAIIEVGLGGRLDSTNIIIPEVSVITNIGLDHTQMLGDTLQKIAFEKAGIIKKSVPVVIGEKQQDVKDIFIKIANERHASIHFAEDEILQNYSTDLLGNYQKKNLRTAVCTIDVLKTKNFNVNEGHIKHGLKNVIRNTGILGRWQVLSETPKIICDTAHNKEGLTYVMHQLNDESFRNLHIVLGMVNDKNLNTVLPLFPAKAIYYFCKPDIPRGLEGEKLQEMAIQYNLKGNIYKSVKTALNSAVKKANNDDLIFVGGSTFVVAEVV